MPPASRGCLAKGAPWMENSIGNMRIKQMEAKGKRLGSNEGLLLLVGKGQMKLTKHKDKE